MTGKPMDFTQYFEDEDIRDAVSQKLHRPLVYLSNIFWRESTKTKTPTSPFHIGDYLRCTK